MNKLLKKVVLTTASFVGLMGVGTLAANASTYTVKSGDSLWKIANDNGTTINSILTDNSDKLSSINSVIYPGEQLELNRVATLAANASTYTVKSGDSLWEIANDNGTTINSILTDNSNKLSSINSVIYPGEQLELNRVATQVSTNNSSYNAPQATYKPATNNYTSSNEQAGTASNTGNNSYASSSDSASSGDSAHSSAANSIAQAESGGSYTAENGQYVGRYQLDRSYLHGDYSPANQDRVFVKYCNQRYGSVNNALSFRESHGWY